MTDRSAALVENYLFIFDLRSILIRRVYAPQYNLSHVVFARKILHGVKNFLWFGPK